MRKEESKVVNTLYAMALYMLPVFILLFFILRTEWADRVLLHGGMRCVYLTLTNHPCPGCGGTRAVMHLVRFNILESIKMNVSVLVAAVMYAGFLIIETLGRWKKTKGLSEKHVTWAVYFFIAVILINWIIKLFLFS